MFRIAISRVDNRRITPVRHETALSVDEAVRAVRGLLPELSPGAGGEAVSDEDVQSSVNRVNDFRQDVTVGDGERYRVVIAPMM
ncbi:hypothetical protein IDM40_10515 [Nocardiopsis sp. HNM0947]|uniref:Uncharacterized protein n=1 Tax=Nocardiopsis coralli TaxID=2772213 RepID=A0ABR9P5P9_9ACTN|nr:hypothetical protein [Nocardiopsis coralli]MBE2999131.1 hypothetical protein [Nocardiopsis coralli]